MLPKYLLDGNAHFGVDVLANGAIDAGVVANYVNNARNISDSI
jgi:hypothetical protein